MTLGSVFLTNVLSVVATIQATKLTPDEVRQAVSIAFTDMSKTRGMYVAEGRGLIQSNARAIAANASSIRDTTIALRDVLVLVGKIEERTKK